MAFKTQPILLSLVFSSLVVLGDIPAEDSKNDPASEQQPHWAFVPLVDVRTPNTSKNTSNSAKDTNAIDAFVGEALAKAGLHASAAAEPHILIRRIYLDLLGIPPEPEAIDYFLSDHQPNAYERLVDRLLQSPRFGERWARHWLDESGYSDVVGTDNDAAIIRELENRWLYRDYVVQSLNDDKPFDQFLVEQLAGDELIDWRSAPVYSSDFRERLVATGFLRASADDTFEKELNLPPTRHGVLERTIEIVANNLFALSLGCAKCHDHKYEPLTQKDYYRFKAIFQPVFNPDDWRQPLQRQVPAISAAEKRTLEIANAKIDDQVNGLQQRLDALRRPYGRRLTEQKLAALPELIRADTQLAIETKPDQRTEVQKYLADKFEKVLRVDASEVAAVLSTEDKATVIDVEREIQVFKQSRHTWQHWQVIADVGPPTPTHLLERGNSLTPGNEVSPGFFTVLARDEGAPFAAPTPNSSSSGRRLALGRLITNPSNPAGSLAIRVRVNRVWQHLFGKGLVATADNFGVTGAPPTHPELLDWLANDFVSHGQRLKPLIRRIVLSNVYRQSSRTTDERAREIDPENKLLWRQRLRRLESEAVRDSILAVSHQLDLKIGGPPVPVDPKPDGTYVERKIQSSPDSQPSRRTLYVLARRNYHPTLLTVFDQPNLTMNCVTRQSSAVVLQSLAMLNDRFVLDQANALAKRTLEQRVASETVIETVFKQVLGRTPSAIENSSCNQAMRREIEWRLSIDTTCPPDEAYQRAFASVCHMLLNTSEFLYVH